MLKMNAFDVEVIRQTLMVELPITHGKSKVFLFYNFYNSLLNSCDKALVEAYSLEFIEEYINLLRHHSPFCLPPEKTAGLIKQLREISELNSIVNFKSQLIKEIERIEYLLHQLENVLFGKKSDEQNLHILSFPLIEENTTTINGIFGFLETVRITVGKSKAGNKLYVFPNAGVTEKYLEKQIKDSFVLSLKYLKNYKKKFHEYHEITVYFDNYSANYIGNSLGIALTVGFIEQLTILYNLPFLVNIKNNISSTGGIDENGAILPVKKEFIEKKVEVVFYSSIEIFIVPKEDEQTALEKLHELKDMYPQRNLRIIGVTDLDDILDRRNLINISKQNPVVRSVKASVRNWQVSLLIAVLYVIIVISLFRNFDESPSVLENQGKIVYVKNKNGSILWTKKTNSNANPNSANDFLKSTQMIIDINNDGTNEVILSSESRDELSDPNQYGRIACFNGEGNLIWSYNFRDSIHASEGSIYPVYSASLVDTFCLNDEKLMLFFANDTSDSQSVIFSLNLKNGKRKGGILKHYGLINDALVYDFNEDGIKEVAFSTINHNNENAALGVISLNDLSGSCPSQNNINNKNIVYAHLTSYILLPNLNFNGKTDDLKPVINEMVNNPIEHCIYLNYTDLHDTYSNLTFKIYYDWQRIDVNTDNRFIHKSDSSSTNGNKIPGFSDKNSLTQILNKDIMYWNGKNFVKKNR